MKYSVDEFAKEIRKINPGKFNHLSDDNLVKYWLNKYPKDISKVDLNKKKSANSIEYFSFLGFISIVFFSYLLYQIYNIAEIGQEAYKIINNNSVVSNLVKDVVNNLTKNRFDTVTEFLHKWLWVLVLSFTIKVIISIRHTLLQKKITQKF